MVSLSEVLLCNSNQLQFITKNKLPNSHISRNIMEDQAKQTSMMQKYTRASGVAPIQESPDEDLAP